MSYVSSSLMGFVCLTTASVAWVGCGGPEHGTESDVAGQTVVTTVKPGDFTMLKITLENPAVADTTVNVINTTYLWRDSNGRPHACDAYYRPVAKMSKWKGTFSIDLIPTGGGAPITQSFSFSSIVAELTKNMKTSFNVTHDVLKANSHFEDFPKGCYEQFR